MNAPKVSIQADVKDGNILEGSQALCFDFGKQGRILVYLVEDRGSNEYHVKVVNVGRG